LVAPLFLVEITGQSLLTLIPLAIASLAAHIGYHYCQILIKPLKSFKMFR